MTNIEFKRGDVLLVDFGEGKGDSVQFGLRPAVVIQNNVGNKFSPTLIVAAITSQTKRNMPTHITLSQEQYRTPKSCMILTEQLLTIDKMRVKERLFSLNDMDSIRLDRALEISIGLVAPRPTNNMKMSKRNGTLAGW